MSTKMFTNQQSLAADLVIDGNTPQLYEHCVKPFFTSLQSSMVLTEIMKL